MKITDHPGPVSMIKSCPTILFLLLFTSNNTHLIAAEKWQDLTIINVNDYPWDKNPRFKSQTKTFFKGPNDSSLIYAHFSPWWDMTPPMDPLGVHYHHWHEWAYVLEGDFVIHEPISPKQQGGMLSHFTQGTWLDRPAYTLHGGVWEVGGMRSQNACTLLIFEEGDGSVVTLGPGGDHFKPDFPDKPVPYKPDWKSVKQFNHPWIVHTTTDLEWESDTKVPGRLLKWLSDDNEKGFRGRLVKIPPGWAAPKKNNVSYYKKANRFIYVIYGDLTIQQVAKPNAKGKPASLTKNYFVHQPPYSLLGYGSGPATETGAVWLEVIYAEGLSVGGGEIEVPSHIR